jgi:hypothetical protein
MDSFELIEGRTVLLQIAEGEYRPATVVKTWGPATANLVVFLDGQNDGAINLFAAGVTATPGIPIGWATSRVAGDGIGQWITPHERASRKLLAGA